jgi:hypothetical protein
MTGDALRRLEPTANVNNTTGYTPLSGVDESEFEGNTNRIRYNKSIDGDSYNETAYYTDAGPELADSVEQLFKILLEYAGVELSVASSIEPLFDKLGQTVLASAQIKKFDVKILPNEILNNYQLSIINPSMESSVLCVTNLNIQSVFRQSLEQGQLHSANVQVGIRVQRVQQEVNLSLLRLVYQFYTVVGNAVEYTGIDEIIKTDPNLGQQQDDFIAIHSRANTIHDHPENGIENIVLKSLHSNLLHMDNNDLADSERPCWKKLRELVAIYSTPPEIKQVSTTRKQQRSNSQPTNDYIAQQQTTNPSVKLVQTRSGLTNTTSDVLLLSAFGWLIIDEIYYAASLGGLKVDGCMRKVQGSVSLSQKLRALQPNTNNQNSKK